MKALIIVDVQKDFCPGGSLSTRDGDKIIPVINQTIFENQRCGNVLIATKDWHPKKSVHFDKWTKHCIAGTEGAKFHDKLLTGFDVVALKGTDNSDTGYSAFEATNVNLDMYLKSLKVTELEVCGIATEYCVEATVLDALRLGYKVKINTMAISAVNPESSNEKKAIAEMKKAGAKFF